MYVSKYEELEKVYVWTDGSKDKRHGCKDRVTVQSHCKAVRVRC